MTRGTAADALTAALETLRAVTWGVARPVLEQSKGVRGLLCRFGKGGS
jgi:hypothetical protein